MEDAARLESFLVATNAMHNPPSQPDMVHSLVKSELGIVLPLHISLSRPLQLVADQLEPFVKEVRRRMQATKVPV